MFIKTFPSFVFTSAVPNVPLYIFDPVTSRLPFTVIGYNPVPKLDSVESIAAPSSKDILSLIAALPPAAFISRTPVPEILNTEGTFAPVTLNSLITVPAFTLTLPLSRSKAGAVAVAWSLFPSTITSRKFNIESLSPILNNSPVKPSALFKVAVFDFIEGLNF